MDIVGGIPSPNGTGTGAIALTASITARECASLRASHGRSRSICDGPRSALLHMGARACLKLVKEEKETCAPAPRVNQNRLGQPKLGIRVC